MYLRHQAMTDMHETDIRTIVAVALAEQQRLHYSNIDTVVLKAIATILTYVWIEHSN